MYLQWIKKSMKTELYLLVINSPKGVSWRKTMENILKRQAKSWGKTNLWNCRPRNRGSCRNRQNLRNLKKLLFYYNCF